MDVHFLLVGSYASVFLITYYSINASGYFSFSHILFSHHFLFMLYLCYMCKCHFDYVHTHTHTHLHARYLDKIEDFDDFKEEKCIPLR